MRLFAPESARPFAKAQKNDWNDALAIAEQEIDSRIEAIDIELAEFAKSNSICGALVSAPGIGVIVATASDSAVACIGDFRGGRDLAAFLGLVPKQRSTGGKTTLLGVSKRGNTYVRARMIHGVRSAFHNRQKRTNGLTAFMDGLVERGLHTNKIVIARANKTARVVWAILIKGATFQQRLA